MIGFSVVTPENDLACRIAGRVGLKVITPAQRYAILMRIEALRADLRAEAKEWGIGYHDARETSLTEIRELTNGWREQWIGAEMKMHLEQQAFEEERILFELQGANHAEEEEEDLEYDYDPNACPGCGGNCQTACR